MKVSAMATLAIAAVLAGGSAIQAEPPGGKLAGYGSIVVEKFTVETNSATQDFPRGQEQAIQENTVRRLLKEKLFEEVVDGAAEAPGTGGIEMTPAPATSATPKRRVKLSGTVTMYDKGSRAARWLVGFGAGATRVKVLFIFRDAETGAELFRTERKGSFSGMIAFVGGGKDQATGEAAGDVVDGLVKQIKKNR